VPRIVILCIIKSADTGNIESAIDTMQPAHLRPGSYVQHDQPSRFSWRYRPRHRRGLTPLAQVRAEPGRYYPRREPACGQSCWIVRGRLIRGAREARPSTLPTFAVEQSFDLVVVGGGIKSGLRGMVLSRGARPRTHPDPGESRRFWRTCKAQRISCERPTATGYGGTESLRPQNLLQQDRQPAAARAPASI